MLGAQLFRVAHRNRVLLTCVHKSEYACVVRVCIVRCNELPTSLLGRIGSLLRLLLPELRPRAALLHR
jgi:hypothetical protein